jgi:hypothetical protein|eukprot:SAG25_NODE_761_length_5514_cov_23.676822_5_plen_106_part_00
MSLSPWHRCGTACRVTTTAVTSKERGHSGCAGSASSTCHSCQPARLRFSVAATGRRSCERLSWLVSGQARRACTRQHSVFYEVEPTTEKGKAAASAMARAASVSA